MKIAHLCAADSKGAGTAASRIHQAQWKTGIDSAMLLLRSWHPSTTQRLLNTSPDLVIRPGMIQPCAHAGIYFSAEQCKVIMGNYPNAQRELELFSSSDAATNLDSCAVLRNADIIQLHWVSGMVNFQDLPEVLKNKPVVWRFSDLNPFTGGCHYSRGCDAFQDKCGNCPQLGSSLPHDISRMQWLQKASAYRDMNLACVAPSRWIADLCRKSSLLGGRDIEVIPNCVPLDLFKPAPAASTRQKFGIDPSHKVFLFAAAGLTNHRKGLRHILNALVYLAREEGNNFSLLTFGALPEEFKINLPFPWHTLPSLDRDEDIAEAYCAADAFLFTPEEENFPSVVLESLACGTPVLGFATGGTAEIVEDGVSGYLCPTGDDLSFAKNIKRFLRLPHDEYQALRRQSRKRAEDFSEEICAARYASLYQTLLKQDSPGGQTAVKNDFQVNIVCYEDTKSWILGKFAEELNTELLKNDVESRILPEPDKYAHVSHHIPYLGWHAEDHALVRTLMITHVDTEEKLDLLHRQLLLADMGVCMSRGTRDELIKRGLPASRLCYIHPGFDGPGVTRKIRLAITSRLYPDARKRENLLVDVMRKLPGELFSIIIMGSGWENQVNELQNIGVEVKYYPEFDKQIYNSIFGQIDYYLYLGMDEGSMGFLDAMAAGVPSIVTEQGFHLDAPAETTMFFKTEAELLNILTKLAEDKNVMRQAVADWTWDNYAKFHLLLWNYLLNARSGSFNKELRDALDNPALPARNARKLIAAGNVPDKIYIVAAKSLHDNGYPMQALHLLEHYLIQNPDDFSSFELYEKWLRDNKIRGLYAAKQMD